MNPARTGLACFLALALGMAACGGDETQEAGRVEVGAPGDDGAGDPDPDVPTDGTGGTGGTGGTDDPMSSAAIQAAVEGAIPAVEILLVTSSVSSDDVIVTIGLGPAPADPLEVCQVAVEYVDSSTDGDSTAVRIVDDAGRTLAERKPGGACEA